MRSGKLKINGKPFNVVIAETAEDQEKGLMFNSNPPIMCFPYPSARSVNFWMKNTPVPLDIIFCLNGQILSKKKESRILRN